MVPLVKLAVTVTSSVALTIPLLVASPAQAAQYNPLSERGLANSSLGAGDVPRWMSRGTTPVARQTYETGRLAGAPEVCLDQSGNFTEARRARQSMGSVVATGMNRELGSFIYQYRTRAEAVRAWSNLESLAAQCESRVEIDLAEQGMSTRMVVKTEVNRTRPLFGTSGLTFFYDFDIAVNAFDTDFSFVGDSYVGYYLAGTSIVCVAFSSGEGTRGVGRVTRGFVDTMSIVIAQRLERRSLR
ncbi:MAG: hypothetical protein ACO3JT_07430 [Candidatus Nanopelagicales bacterium]